MVTKFAVKIKTSWKQTLWQRAEKNSMKMKQESSHNTHTSGEETENRGQTVVCSAMTASKGTILFFIYFLVLQLKRLNKGWLDTEARTIK